MSIDLDNVRIDWSDFARAGEQSRQIVRELAADTKQLRELLCSVERDERRLAMSERHQLLDYVVLYDAVERGFRLRLHLATSDHLDRPHDHRFSFSSFIMRGRYRHVQHQVKRTVYRPEDVEQTKQWMSLRTPDPRQPLDDVDLESTFERDETAGSCYTLHHTAIHTTVTTDGTVSLFLRGPAEKERSIIYDRETRKMWWRFGAHDEPPARRAQKRMSMAEYVAFRDRVQALGVI